MELVEHRSQFLLTCGMSGRFSRTIYVGNLPSDIREWEVEDIFYKYGRILDIELKIPLRPPCFCFVEFEDPRDAEDAIRGRDGYNFDGCRLRVELAHGGRGQSSSDRRGGYGGAAAKFGVSRHSEYRGSHAKSIVCGLPSSASWQDLKDHMRKAGDMCFVEISRDSDGTFGIVDFTNYDDMKYAISKLDDTEFRNPWARAYIQSFLTFLVQTRAKTPPIFFHACSKSRERPASNSPVKARSVSPVKSSRLDQLAIEVHIQKKQKVQALLALKERFRAKIC
ncbi:hypothetical protein GOBAR_AA26640 [Gossypium barbadense]|uniref:RRM domain-containing protein n=1 Tax=Gossypium barbadense TaxID=3634 RepID=A0A2P5WSG9_GOSBA|nr:hypothetical protein GOBAR_AA26640 [Gossypium barbadense]